MNGTRFSDEMIVRANEIICDNNLSDFQKFGELVKILYDEGYKLDDMTDFLLELNHFRIVN